MHAIRMKERAYGFPFRCSPNESHRLACSDRQLYVHSIQTEQRHTKKHTTKRESGWSALIFRMFVPKTLPFSMPNIASVPMRIVTIIKIGNVRRKSRKKKQRRMNREIKSDQNIWYHTKRSSVYIYLLMPCAYYRHHYIIIFDGLAAGARA